eukprot:CAMPEP_0168323284 /NCGR_PEP_ID=MMETSP0213-20121227/3392_1 /TAXON_ID=151035 /ORGANISM="Euplotes harpa, Strain FSP1.4" /LENGTH=425 /DNA_ID=CAMNT_0008325331 /DNA_START=123 /DNA_END=1400 /DNA_ORIENTATION=+
MLDGVPTTQFKHYKYLKDENDVEINSNDGESTFYVHNIKLNNPVSVQVEVAREKLLKATSTVTSDGSGNSAFEVKVKYDCTAGLAGISEVYITFTLDGNLCTSSTIGVRKKCGSQYSYSPLEISETSFWGIKKNILTDNGGQSSHAENLFDSNMKDNIVFGKSVSSLSFRVKNVARPGDTRYEIIDLDPPVVRIENEAENIVYPVLRGAGARKRSLKIGEYTDFKLEFNCISLDTDTETMELIFRPSYFTNYKFKMTKECEGLTAGNLLKKEFEDSLVFDFFAFIFLFLVLLTIMILLTSVYVRYKNKGRGIDWKAKASNTWESIRNVFKGDDESRNFGQFARKSGSNFEADDIEESHLRTEDEFDLNDALKINSKKKSQQAEDHDFSGKVSVKFDRDEEDFPTHELKEVEKPKPSSNSNQYGTL